MCYTKDNGTGSRLTWKKTGGKETVMKKETLEAMTQHVLHTLKNASPDAVQEVISHLDQIWNALYDESEKLEQMDVVVDLEPDQRKRAADLEYMLGILCSMMNLCYDVLPKEGETQ